MTEQKHHCTEQSMVWNPHTEKVECVECGKELGAWGMIDYLMAKTNSTTGVCFSKLDRDITMLSQHKERSRQQSYAEYAALFFYDDFPTLVPVNTVKEEKGDGQ